MAVTKAIEELREKCRKLVKDNNLRDETVQINIGTLTVNQAIGNPERRDFPLIEGKEVMIEAKFHDSYGQAFTDRPHEFNGSINEVLNLSLTTNDERAVFVATFNALMAHLGMVTGTRHCRNEEPEECAAEMAAHILSKYGKVKVGMIGLQPAILDNMVKTLGAENVRCTDLAPDNINTRKYGAEIWDGKTETENLIKWANIVLATSSTINNGTFDGIHEIADALEKPLIIFGVTGAGVAELLGLERLCFQPH